ncbi:MAG: class I SAM-dependent methyltransferase [Coriobacteriia bacterium]|nr:class I SAM-dependent methyltransferase [Coriobacteriia bacterium]
MDEKWYETYNQAWEIYDKFSEYEDFEDKAFAALLGHVDFTGKTVYEYGCGTGKYTRKLAEACLHLYANDISPLMVEVAKERCAGLQNVTFITASAENSGLPDQSVDIVFGAWAGPPFDEHPTIEMMEGEFDRILTSEGSVWIFTNYFLGEFTRMREIPEGDTPEEAVAFFTDYMGRYNYELAEVVSAYWQFPDLDEAKRISGFIFGEKAIDFFNKKGSPIMEDNIAIFRRSRRG